MNTPSRHIVILALFTATLTSISGGEEPKLPENALERIQKHEEEIIKLRTKARDDEAAAMKKLIEDLKKMQNEFEKNNKFIEATAIARKLALLRGEEVRLGNLIVNGSFEDGPEINADLGFTTLMINSEAINGWKVTKGSIDVVSSDYWMSSDGKRSLDMNGIEAGGISQKFVTVKNQKYKLTFDMGANPGAIENKNAMMIEVKVAGVSKTFSFDGTDTNAQQMGWKTMELEFTANDTKTTLEFLSKHNERDPSGPALDNVKVVPAR